MPGKPRAKPPAVRLEDNEETRSKLAALGHIQCTLAETAAAMGLSPTGLRLHFRCYPAAKAAFDKGRGEGIEGLRRAQFKLAQTSSTMAMFLGRLYLDQSEHREDEQSVPAETSGALQRLRNRLAALYAEAPDKND